MNKSTEMDKITENGLNRIMNRGRTKGQTSDEGTENGCKD